MELVAMRKHPYGKRMMQVGDEYEARDKDAELLILQRRARKAEKPSPKPAPAPPPHPQEPPAEPQPKRRYNRRDMVPVE